MRSVEEYRLMLESTLEKFGEPWKGLPVETVIGFISDYKVVSSDTLDEMKILKLKKKDKRIELVQIER